MLIENEASASSQHGSAGTPRESDPAELGLDHETMSFLSEEARRQGRSVAEMVANYKELEGKWNKLESELAAAGIPPELKAKAHQFIAELLRRSKIDRDD